MECMLKGKRSTVGERAWRDALRCVALRWASDMVESRLDPPVPLKSYLLINMP